MSCVMQQQAERRCSRTSRARVALDHELGLEVERRERLVEQQHLRLVDQRARERHALAHAARERRGIVVGEAVQAELVEQRMRALARLARAACPCISSPSITLVIAVRQGNSRSFCSM